MASTIDEKYLCLVKLLTPFYVLLELEMNYQYIINTNTVYLILMRVHAIRSGVIGSGRNEWR